MARSRKLNISDEYSNSEEDTFEDDWNDYKAVKNLKPKFIRTPREKTVNENKQQPRLKAMVRYPIPSTPHFDEQTKALLHQLKDARYMNDLHYIIGTGSNSVVLYGTGASKPQEIVVKVYETGKSDNETLYERVQNEFKSLDKIYRCQINCPKPICAQKNVIIMSSIGKEKTANSITTAKSRNHPKNYLYIINSMKKMYQSAKIVHGHLSSKSILYIQQPHFISLGQSVPADHPKALELLIKDCYSVTNIYKNKGFAELKTAEELFKFVTDLPAVDAKLLKILENMKPADVETHSRSYNSNSSFYYDTPSVISYRQMHYIQVLDFCRDFR